MEFVDKCICNFDPFFFVKLEIPLQTFVLFCLYKLTGVQHIVADACFTMPGFPTWKHYPYG